MEQPVKHHSAFLDRQQRERELLKGLYVLMGGPFNERKFMRASRVADTLGYATSFVDAAARTFEKCEILHRRLEFGAKNEGTYVAGRSFHWTLLMSGEDALAALDKYHADERQDSASAQGSVKSRVLSALALYGKFETMEDLAKIVRRNGENLDFHNLTHVMESLAKQGKITFDRGTTKDRIPYNITLAKKKPVVSKPVVEEPIKPEDIVIEEPSPVITDDEEPTPIQVIVVDDTLEYPTIVKLVNRKQWLEDAAKLAENSQEEDLAILLLERANKPFTTLESEAVALFEAYKACKENR